MSEISKPRGYRFKVARRISDPARQELHSIILGQRACDQFIIRVEEIFTRYLQSLAAYRRGNSIAAERREIEHIGKAAARCLKHHPTAARRNHAAWQFAAAMCTASPGTRRWIQRGLILAGLGVCMPGPKEVAAAAKAFLQATQPTRRGRPANGLDILLITGIAKTFEDAGGRVSSGDRSPFVRVVKILSDDLGLGWGDARQKVRNV